MKRQNVITKKRRGPAPTGKGILVGVRLQPDRLHALDKWIAEQGGALTRPEAIRAMLDTVLVILQQNEPKEVDQQEQKARAKELAGGAIDKLTDAKAAPDDQASRKRRLLKGPEEFRELRVDRPKRK